MILFNLIVSALLPCFILLVMRLISHKCTRHFFQKHENPPPSPWKLPIIGNLHQLSGNQRSLSKLAKKHGPLMLLHLGSVPVLIASSADAAHEILKNHEPMFLDRIASSNIRKITYNIKDVAFSPYGEYWRYAKKIVVHHLLSHKKVLSYKKVREEEVTLLMDTIKKSCDSLVNFSDLLISHTNNVFSRVALGRKFETKNVKNFIELSSTVTGLFMFEDYIPSLSWIDKLRGLDSTIENHLKNVDEFLEDVIEEHLRKKRRESDNDKSCAVDQEQLFIDVLLEHKEDDNTTNKEDDNTTSFCFERNDIKALLLDMFVAGTIQTFSTLEWALSELVRNPKTMKKLQEEIREFAQGKPNITEEDLTKLEYLNAVFKETLRLHPSPPLIPRELNRDLKLMGYDIKCGTKVFINTWAIGRDPTLWDEHDVFKPERFLSSPIDYFGAYFELIPFGTGKRICPGIQYSKAINEITLANLVYKFDFALPNGEKPEDLDTSEGSGALIHRKNNLFLVPTLAFK